MACLLTHDAVLSPLRGSLTLPLQNPRLAPWAAFFHHLAALS